MSQLVGRGQVFSLAPTSFQEALTFCKMMADSDMVPRDYVGHPGRILAAIQYGAEVGMPPMQALQHIYVQQGKPTMNTRGCLALAKGSGLLVDHVETWDPETNTATVTLVRKGQEGSPYTRTFSVEDAKKVACKEDGRTITLDQKGTYRAYPQRMYTRRALGYALIDAFPDVLAGLTPWEIVHETIADPEETEAPPASDVPALLALDPDLAKRLDTGFDLLKMMPAQRRLKLQQFRGREEELLDWLRREYAIRNGKALKAAEPEAQPAQPDLLSPAENNALDAEVAAR